MIDFDQLKEEMRLENVKKTIEDDLRSRKIPKHFAQAKLNAVEQIKMLNEIIKRTRSIDSAEKQLTQIGLPFNEKREDFIAELVEKKQQLMDLVLGDG